MQAFLFVSLVVAGVAVEIHQPSSRPDDMKSTLHKGLMRSEPASASKPESLGNTGSELVQDHEQAVTSADPQEAQALETAEKTAASNTAKGVQAEVDEVDELEDEDEDEDEDDDLPNATKKCCGNTTGKQVTLVAQSKDSATVAKIAAKLSADAKILARDEKHKLGDLKQVAALVPKKNLTTITPCPFGRGPNVTKTTLGCGGRLQVQAKLNSDDRSVALQKMAVKNGIRSLREATAEMIKDRKFIGEGTKLKIGKVSKNKKWAGTPNVKEVVINNAVAKLALKLIKDAKKLEAAELVKLTDSSGCGNATASLKKASTTDDKAVDKSTVKVDKDINKIAKLSSAGAVSGARHKGSR